MIQDWKTEFNTLFGYASKVEIEEFIESLLKEERNAVLSEVEKEVEELYRHTVTGKVEDVLLVRRKDISTIINNLRVK